MFSFLNGQGEKKTSLFVDSINLQVMTELKLPGGADPLAIAEKKFFSVPFFEEDLSLRIAENDYFLSEDHVSMFVFESSLLDWNVALPLPNTTYAEGVVDPSTDEALSEEAKEALELIYHFLLKDAPSGNYTFKAINRLQTQISAELIANGYYGVAVTIDPDQIDLETNDDYREEGDTSLNLRIWLGEVIQQRTIAKGGRIKGDDPIDHPFHRHIIRNSPFYEYSQEGEFLINKHYLDKYISRLNQNPRRRVDVSLASGGAPGKVVLDYIVSESKPWTVYLQASNTGTEATGEWRERIGGVHYQLTDNDDSLSLDYLTAEFDRAHAVLASYELPLVRPDYLKLKTFFKYSDFAAENILFPTNPDSEGQTTTFGAELAYTPFYWNQHAFSATLGIVHEDIEFLTSTPNANNGEVALLSPYLRLEASKQKQLHRSTFSISYEENLDTSDGDDNNLTLLGRFDSAIDHKIVRFDLFQSFFIEPLLSSYYEVNPDKWLANSLIHEFVFSLSGQEALEDVRLITQKQFFGGGFFTVRGYNESAARGDSGLIGSAEYRIHLARLLRPASMLKEIDADGQVPNRTVRNRFNYRAPSLYGIPDWDFLMRGFFDWASLSLNGELSSDETEQDLRSAGVGFEFQYRSNLTIRLDYGVVLKELFSALDTVEDDGDEGDSRFHFLATFSF